MGPMRLYLMINSTLQTSQISRLVENFGGCVFFVLGTVAALCVVYPFFFIPVLVVSVIYYRVQQVLAYLIITMSYMVRLIN